VDNRLDQQLVADYLAGDERALEILFKLYLKPIYSFIYRYAGNSSNAEDITQEVFVKVWRNLKKFDQNKSFKTWIFTIAKNTAIDFLKKSRFAFGEKKIIPFSELSAKGGFAFGEENKKNNFIENLIDSSPLPLEILERKELAQTLGYAIDKLLPKYRVVFSLRYNNGLTFREISETLKEPLNTVKSKYRRAFIMLKNFLSDFEL